MAAEQRKLLEQLMGGTSQPALASHLTFSNAIANSNIYS